MKERPTQCAVKVMFIVAYVNDGVILHHAVPLRRKVNAVYYCKFLQHHIRPQLRRNDEIWWYRTPSFFMTMQGVTSLQSGTFCSDDNERFWNIYNTQPDETPNYDLLPK